MSRRLPALLVAALAVVAVAVPAVPTPAGAEGAAEGTYRPPVEAPVTDPFRPPANPYGPGNRGIDLGTEAGDDVVASSGGEVVFAGPVAGDLHVVIAHPDGLRTSYSFLGSVAVRPGDVVEAGQRVGRASEQPLHFGVRAGEAYLDPEALFDEPVRVWLVPHRGVTRAEEVARRRVVDRLFDEPDVIAALGRGIRWARGAAAATARTVRDDVVAVGAAVAAEVDALHQELLTYAHYLHELDAAVHVLRAAEAAVRWWDQRDECTPAATPVPPPPPERRIVVLVAGLNSSSAEGAVDDVDTAALGYEAGDVVRFSYAGGDAPYGPDHTRQDLRIAGRLLLDRLRQIRLDHPGVPVDVIAHSQGGVVARLAMNELDPLDPRNPDVVHLITLGTPHHGADVATGAAQVARSGTGELVLQTVNDAAHLGLGTDEVAIQQLSETSDLVRDLAAARVPDHVELTSIAARGDLVVPAGRSHVDGATNTIVATAGLTAHDRLPGTPEAHREMALALAGLDPTCDGFGTWMLDHVASDAIAWGEDAAGFGAAVWARRLDGRLPGTSARPVALSRG